MYTPKLKRNQQSVFSTIDQTISNSFKVHSQRNISKQPPLASFKLDGKLQIKSYLQRSQLSALEYRDVESFQSEMKNINQKDVMRCEKNVLNKGNYQSYAVRPVSMKLSKGKEWNYPQKVQDLYDESEQVRPNTNFIKGLLPRSSILYFAIENKVLFYDLGISILNQKNLQDCFMKLVEFKNLVYEIRQIEWTFKEFKVYKNKNMILISHPYELSFAIIQTQFNDGLDRQKLMRWLRITPMYHQSINTCHAQKMLANKSHIYYLDERGTLNQASLKDNTTLGRIIDGKKYKLKFRQQESRLTLNHFYVNKKVFFPKNVLYYVKVLGSYAMNYFYREIKNYDLIQDYKRNLVYTLIDNCSKGKEETSSHSFSKVLTCYSTKDDQIVQKCRISQLQLYETELKDIFEDFHNESSKIVKLQIIDKQICSQCNLIIILNNGTRLFFKVDQSFQLVYHLLPPYLQEKMKKKKNQSERLREVKLVSYFQLGNIALMNVAQKNANYTCIIWKVNEQKQKQNFILTKWKNTILGTQQTQVSEQSTLNDTTLCLNTKKIQYYDNVQRQQKISMKYMHETAKGFFGNPEVIVHMTENILEYFYMLRPVDILFNIMLSNVASEAIISRIFNEHDKGEILFMLTQLYCDVQGIYIKDHNLIQLIINYQRKINEEEISMNFNDFALEYQKKNQNFKMYRSQKSKKIKLTSNVIKRIDFTVENQRLIRNISVELLIKNDGIKKYERSYAQIQQGLSSSILCYLSRVLSFIWNKKVKDIDSKCLYLMELISPLSKFIDFVDRSQKVEQIKHRFMKENDSKVVRQRIIQVSRPKQTQKGQNLLKIKQYISKIQQIILLCGKIQLKIQKNFNSLLIFEPTYFQSFIFNFMIQNYNTPIRYIDEYKHLFPLFVTQNLIKALNIYQDCKDKQKLDIIAIIRYHKMIPSYLYESLMENYHFNGLERKDIQKNNVQHFQNNTLAQKLSQKCQKNITKNQILQVFQKIIDNSSGKSLNERSLLIINVKRHLNQYLQEHDHNHRQIFYHSKIKLINDLQKKVNFQELILKYYDPDTSPSLCPQNNEQLQGLETVILDDEQHQQIIRVIDNPVLSIAYYYYFDKKEENICRQFKRIGDETLRQRGNGHDLGENKGWLNRFMNIFRGQNNSDYNQWRRYEKMVHQIVENLSFPMAKDFDWNSFINPIINSLLNHLQPTADLILEIFSNFSHFLLNSSQNNPSNNDLIIHVNEEKVPSITVILINSGLSYKTMKDFFENTLRLQRIQAKDDENMIIIKEESQDNQDHENTHEKEHIKTLYILLNALILTFFMDNNYETYLKKIQSFMKQELMDKLEQKDQHNIQDILTQLQILNTKNIHLQKYP